LSSSPYLLIIICSSLSVSFADECALSWHLRHMQMPLVNTPLPPRLLNFTWCISTAGALQITHKPPSRLIICAIVFLLNRPRLARLGLRFLNIAFGTGLKLIDYHSFS